MTDDHLDELASAYLDGAASADEVARVEADPAAMARVAALAEVRAALRAVAPLTSARREEALAAARAAFHEEDRGARAGAPTPRPTPLPRRHWSPRTVRVVGAAAVALAVAALVPLLGRLGDDDDAQATRFEDTGAAIGGGAQDAATPEALPSTTAGRATAGADDGGALDADLGDFADVDALLAALAGPEAAAYRATVPNESAAPVRGAGTCPEPFTPAGPAARWLSARLGDEPVLVAIVTTDDGATTATVYRLADCERIGGGPLP